MKNIETKILKPLESYWNWNRETLDRISNLKDCKQSKIHHAEGDVYVHTQMVAEQMANAISKGKFFGKQPETLMLSALLHDIAKPDTTVFDNLSNDYVSPGHAKLGEKLARELLHNQLSFSQREEIAAFVRYHGLPIWNEEKEDPAMNLITASLRCNIKQLSLLAECDFKGRICQDLDDMLLRIEMFLDRAERLGCLECPYPFKNDWSRMHYFTKGGYYGKEIWEPEGSWLTIMCGVAGSSKSTWVSENWHGSIIELDAIRIKHNIKPTDKNAQGFVAQEAKELLRENLRKKQNVLWDATNLTKLQRASIIDLALQYKAKIKT